MKNLAEVFSAHQTAKVEIWIVGGRTHGPEPRNAANTQHVESWLETGAVMGTGSDYVVVAAGKTDLPIYIPFSAIGSFRFPG